MTVGEAQAAHKLITFVAGLALWELRAGEDAMPDRVEGVAAAAVALGDRVHARLGVGVHGEELREQIRDALGLPS